MLKDTFFYSIEALNHQAAIDFANYKWKKLNFIKKLILNKPKFINKYYNKYYQEFMNRDWIESND